MRFSDLLDQSNNKIKSQPLKQRLTDYFLMSQTDKVVFRHTTLKSVSQKHNMVMTFTSFFVIHPKVLIKTYKHQASIN